MAEEGEVSGLTEMQLLEAEVASLQKTLKSLSEAENTSSACSRILQKIKAAEERDGFLVKEGVAQSNQYHTSSGQGGDGCCVVM